MPSCSWIRQRQALGLGGRREEEEERAKRWEFGSEKPGPGWRRSAASGQRCCSAYRQSSQRPATPSISAADRSFIGRWPLGFVFVFVFVFSTAQRLEADGGRRRSMDHGHFFFYQLVTKLVTERFRSSCSGLIQLVREARRYN
ncbi:hypothetical protein MGYG_08910 [Nannizzia gypsea CBS 118893]|uniref:Uncharacterized protein n=1 Tax=Arthroderma gypseum (strain ATCC MYA-4604 / CBS 118893) TaxID=535722 RepID=E5R2I7_ARTGP|nr:hypothetical protein MGYG_08910 [Nannizzia gypsea CBS 118893]EFQ97863.1 hypothetical protein MGYG_08910 [Nannizzia gypsea CBS 118893]